MYGFHKIPHLQQGVLRSEKDTEFWNFAHPSFQQGQPDLLVFIQRKKQAAQLGDEVAVDIRDPGTTASATANLSSGQILDIHSIVNGIAAIKRHQTTISAELNELKRSNHLLWQDSMAARARHQKHQDTLNRIVKFLAGVFGQNAAPAHKEDGLGRTPSRAVVPRKHSHLMIEGRPIDEGKQKVDVTDIEDEESGAESQSYGEPSSLSSSEYTSSLFPMSLFDMTLGPAQIGTVETPRSETSPSVPPSDHPSPLNTDMSSYLTSTPQTTFTPTPGEPLNARLPSPIDTKSAITAPQPWGPQPIFSEQSITPSTLTSRPPSSTNTEFDHPKIQGILNQLSAGQIQQLLASLASQSIPDPLAPPGSDEVPSSSQLTSYQPPFDFTQFSQQPPIPLVSPPPLQPPGEGLIPFDLPLENTDRLEKTWKATEDIDKDVNALQSSISSLIQTFGLDPNLMTPAHPEEAELSAHDPSLLLSDVHEPPGDSALQDFDFDSFLNSFPNNDNADYGDIASTVFLDEVPSPSDGTASPIANLRHDSPDLQKITGRKRKSDVAEREDGHRKTTNSTPPGVKVKRRKEK